MIKHKTFDERQQKNCQKDMCKQSVALFTLSSPPSPRALMQHAPKFRDTEIYR